MKLKYELCCKCKKTKKVAIFNYTKRPILEMNFNIKGKYERIYYECLKCKHMFNQHEMKWKNIYSSQYFKSTYKNNKELQKRFNAVNELSIAKSDNKKRVNRITKNFNKENLEVLDVGAGIGVFLYQMKKKNWNITGIEVDKKFSNFGKRFNLNILNKNIFKYKTKKKFDLITFNKVLEHVESPMKMLKHSKRLLKKKGLIYIELPSVKAKKYGKQREEFCVDHLQVFSPKSLKLIIKYSGLSATNVKDIKEPSGKYTIYGFAKFK